MIHLYTGEGKGKTTAAVGLCVRAAGRGFPVCFAQFMKGNDTGEVAALKCLPGVTILRSDREFGFYHTLSAEDKAALTRIHNEILDRLCELAGSCRLIVLDEVTYPVNWGLLDREKLKRLLALGKTGELDLVLTGRDAADFLKAAADYLTEMVCVRHPYEKGLPAREGIES